MAGVMTLGTFDLFHRGHVRLLARAAELGPVTVALNRDHFVEQYKGRKPIMGYQERYEVVKACRHVQAVIPNSDNGNSRGVIVSVHPKYIVIGDDWLQKDYLGQLQIDREFLAKEGISIVFVPYTDSISTTELLRRADQSRRSESAQESAPQSDLPEHDADPGDCTRVGYPPAGTTPISLSGRHLPRAAEQGRLGTREASGWTGARCG